MSKSKMKNIKKKAISNITAEDIKEILKNENIQENYIMDILEENACIYYNEIIFHRAIPDARDGLTDVQRRIIWTDIDKNWTYTKPHVKSGRVVGETMGRFHPHGDSSIYETSVNMTQPWKNNCRLIDWHGNYGSISGKDAAAMRYTEQRLSKEAVDLCINGINDNAVDFTLNYEQSEKEPLFLPVKLPLLLINGSFGLGAGFMSGIPLHNPREVIDQLVELVKNENHQVEILPDYPSGGIITNTDKVKNIYQDFEKYTKNKSSSMIMRATIEKDETNNILYITSLPYMVTGEALIFSIQKATKDGKDNFGRVVPAKVTGIKDIRNISSGNNIRIKIEVKKGFNLDTLISQLYSDTLCQKTTVISFIAVENDKLIQYKNITEVFQKFLDFRMTTIKRIKSNVIRKNKLRIHILEGLLKILDKKIIDKVLSDIRDCKSRLEVLTMLMDKYELSNIQAENIAEYKLYQLASLELEKLLKEKIEKEKIVEEELLYFKDENKLKSFILDELSEIKDKYFPEKNYQRKTILENISCSSEENFLSTIPDENYILFSTKMGYIKKIQMIENQKRNTKGISVGKLKENDYLLNISSINSRDKVLIFTDKGKVYKKNIYEIPTCNTSNYGYNISSYINNENIISILPIKNKEFENENNYFLIATKLNLIKLVPFSEFTNIFKTGIIASKLKENDRVLTVEKVNSEKQKSVIALNSIGNAIRIPITEIPINKRVTYGSNLFSSRIDIEVTSVSVVDDNKKYCFLITKNGLGKKMNIDDFSLQKRNTKGKMACKLKENDKAVKLISLNNNDNILIVSNKKIVNITGSTVNIIGRTTYGCSIKNCESDEYIIDCNTINNN